MVERQSNLTPSFSDQGECCLYDIDPRTIYSMLLDAINHEIDYIVHLLLEGNGLLEAMDDDIDIDDVTAIVRNLNDQLCQHATRMRALKCKVRKKGPGGSPDFRV